MKNYWLDKKGEFPQTDERSIQAGCCGDFACNCFGNLDVYYGMQFIENEVLQVLDKSKYGVTVYQTTYTPIYAGSMIGTIAFEGCDAFTFCISAAGLFVPTRVGKSFPPNSDLPIFTEGVYSGELNLLTGEFKLVWDACEVPVVTVCYEFVRP